MQLKAAGTDQGQGHYRMVQAAWGWLCLFCTVPQHDSISLHTDKTPPPLIMSIFHEEGPSSSVFVFSCTGLDIILYLAKSCIDPTLYLISMHRNVLCTACAVCLSLCLLLDASDLITICAKSLHGLTKTRLDGRLL